MISPASPDGMTPPLLERDRELDRIEAALASARQGTGAGVIIEGSAGIGKTALLGSRA